MQNPLSSIPSNPVNPNSGYDTPPFVEPPKNVKRAKKQKMLYAPQKTVKSVSRITQNVSDWPVQNLTNMFNNIDINQEHNHHNNSKLIKEENQQSFKRILFR